MLTIVMVLAQFARRSASLDKPHVHALSSEIACKTPVLRTSSGASPPLAGMSISSAHFPPLSAGPGAATREDRSECKTSATGSPANRPGGTVFRASAPPFLSAMASRSLLSLAPTMLSGAAGLPESSTAWLVDAKANVAQHFSRLKICVFETGCGRSCGGARPPAIPAGAEPRSIPHGKRHHKDHAWRHHFVELHSLTGAEAALFRLRDHGHPHATAAAQSHGC
jgi:hypothetical protein